MESEGLTTKAIAHCPRKLRTKLDHSQNCGGVAYCPKKTLQLGEGKGGRKRKTDYSLQHGCPYNLRPPKPTASNHSGCNICLQNGGGDSDGDRKRCAEEVVRQNPRLELVEAGPLAVGYSPKGCIVHMNFNAKLNEKPVVETFFAELTITNRNAVVVNNYARIGPSDSLPETADTGACLYCSSHNIHHPDYYLHPFRCGREQHLATLTYQVKQLLDFIAKGEKEDVCFSPRFSHPGVKYISKHSLWKKDLVQFRQHKGRDVTEHANVALSLFNKLQGENFVLVGIGHSAETRFTRVGTVIHLNFEAVDKDDYHAIVQTFFAEVICTLKFIFADFCKCLGPSFLLPESCDADLHGCRICRVTHHPPGPGYLTGREYFEKS